MWSSSLVLLDLVEGQLDRCLPTENLDQPLDLLRVGVDLMDGRLKGRERTVDDGDGVTHLEVEDLDLDLAALLLFDLGREDVDHFLERERDRLVSVADEPGDPR